MELKNSTQAYNDKASTYVNEGCRKNRIKLKSEEK
jgi:hypothetical protein